MLKYRIISGTLIGAAFLLAATLMPRAGAWLVLVALSTLGQLEFYRIMNRGGIPVFRFVGVFCGAAMISATFFNLEVAGSTRQAYDWEELVLTTALILVFVRQFPQKHNDKPLATIGCTLLGIWYVPFLFNYITRLACSSWGDAATPDKLSFTGRMLVLYLVVVVKSGDMGAYTVGRLIGRHKLFPRISPGKTWEGLAGAIAASLGVSLLFTGLSDGRIGSLAVPLPQAAVLGVLLSLAGVMGDMFESLIKRAGGAKDSGSTIPGMGGVLDVLDSLFFAAPLMYIFARFFLAQSLKT